MEKLYQALTGLCQIFFVVEYTQFLTTFSPVWSGPEKYFAELHFACDIFMCHLHVSCTANGSNFSLWVKPYSVAIQMKAI